MINEGLLNRGGGRPGLITMASDLIRKGLKLDPTPIKKYDSAEIPKFEKDLLSALKSVEDKKSSLTDFKDQAKKIISRMSTAAFFAGTRTIDPNAALDDKDTKLITSFVAKQMDYLSNFAKSVRDGTGVMPVERRVALYSRAADSLFIAGTLTRLPKGTVIYWRLNPAEHCTDCMRLSDEGPYTLDNLPALPRDGSTACKTQCKCTLEFTSKVKKSLSKLFKP